MRVAVQLQKQKNLTNNCLNLYVKTSTSLIIKESLVHREFKEKKIHFNIHVDNCSQFISYGLKKLLKASQIHPATLFPICLP